MREIPIRRALLSVSDKTGLVELGRSLASLGVELLATGGTFRALVDAGLKAREIAEYTGFPEMMDGRVKTLHPKVHGGILFRRDLDDHAAAAEKHGIAPIDLVVVSLYPFEKTVASPNVRVEEAIERNKASGIAVLLVEQYLEFAWRLADSYAIMRKGSIVSRGATADLRHDMVREHLTV